jgi:hypothetical protein
MLKYKINKNLSLELDYKNAYNRVDSYFLEDMLLSIGFEQK